VTSEPPPTAWQIAQGQIANPMNVMLVVGLLVTLNVVMGTNQERKAMASVDALTQLQVPTRRPRSGRRRSRRWPPLVAPGSMSG